MNFSLNVDFDRYIIRCVYVKLFISFNDQNLMQHNHESMQFFTIRDMKLLLNGSVRRNCFFACFFFEKTCTYTAQKRPMIFCCFKISALNYIWWDFKRCPTMQKNLWVRRPQFVWSWKFLVEIFWSSKIIWIEDQKMDPVGP